MGLTHDRLWIHDNTFVGRAGLVTTYKRRRLGILERVFLLSFTLGLFFGAFGATAAWLVVR